MDHIPGDPGSILIFAVYFSAIFDNLPKSLVNSNLKFITSQGLTHALTDLKVFRKDDKAYPATGFQMENALSREETLRGMTLWAAKGNFEEKEKGSIEKGKFADFVILDQDIMIAKPEEVLKVRVLKTYINGENVFELESGN